MADVGYYTLLLALITALYSAITFIIGVKRNKPAFIQSARNALIATSGLVTLAVVILLYAILSHNFQIEYVANYTSREMSLPYLISALWAGADGSLLFWAWILSICAVIAFRKKESTNLHLYASAVTMMCAAFFIILLASVSNPFVASAHTPIDGMGLNPLLENPGMIIHPPLLLAGYVTFTIPFSYAIAALITNKLGFDWITDIRRWTIIAWLFLGVGNIIGAWWAYVELGWGGYWAWDPVENAGLMPWLLLTAFLHSVMVQRRAGMMKKWNVSLILFAFILVIFGTFLTRSGVLSSVHTYSQKGIGVYFIVFLTLLIISSVSLLLLRNKELSSESDMKSLLSREGTFLLINILFVVATAVIFIGTIFPGISEAIRGTKIEVGPSFFNQVNGPIFSVIILLISICTLIGWKTTKITSLLKKLLWPGVISAIAAILLFVFWLKEWLALFAFFFTFLVFFTILSTWFRNILSRQKATGENRFNSFLSLFRINKNRYGAYIIHLGMVLLAFGIIGSSLFDFEKTETLYMGDTLEIGNYTLQFNGLSEYEDGFKDIVQANINVYHDEEFLKEMTPEKIFHANYSQAVTEVAIHSSLAEDLYIALGGWYEDGASVFEVSVNPLVIWIWIGGGILTLGGIICFWPDNKSEKSNDTG
ncbi:heme lyase CcmF/NrfE family subunit [Chloroflexota bacterium]